MDNINTLFYLWFKIGFMLAVLQITYTIYVIVASAEYSNPFRSIKRSPIKVTYTSFITIPLYILLGALSIFPMVFFLFNTRQVLSFTDTGVFSDVFGVGYVTQVEAVSTFSNNCMVQCKFESYPNPILVNLHSIDEFKPYQ